MLDKKKCNILLKNKYHARYSLRSLKTFEITVYLSIGTLSFDNCIQENKLTSIFLSGCAALFVDVFRRKLIRI